AEIEMLQTRNEKLEKDRADYKTQCDKLENRVGVTPCLPFPDCFFVFLLSLAYAPSLAMSPDLAAWAVCF
ncbi:hypothetical protein ElyMa_006251100, partial [Elysia marginata]